MTIAYLCLLFACVLPIVCAGIAKGGMLGVPPAHGGYDNRDPRAWLAQQGGWRARADAAQTNSFEALPLFTAAVLVAHQLRAPQLWVDALALLFIVLRAAYIALYVGDRNLARSAVWTLAWATSVAIFFTPFLK